MPIYTFQERFVQFVKEGSKRQTIRNFRKYPVRVGQFMHPYTGSRFRPVKIKEKEPITDVCCISIFPDDSIYLIAGNWLTIPERELIKKKGIQACDHSYRKLMGPMNNDFAYADGFRPQGSSIDNPKGCHDLMMNSWDLTHDSPFVGFVTYW